MSHENVIAAFAARKINRRHDAVNWTTSNVFCEGDLLYSYGRHFALAKYLGESLFLKNGDKYSSSTSHHQGITDHHCPGPVVSAVSLRKNGMEFHDMKFDNVVFWQKACRKFVYRDDKTGLYYEKSYADNADNDRTNEWFVGGLEGQLTDRPWTPPDSGEFVPTYKRKERDHRIIPGTWYIAGAVVIRNAKRHYLSFVDAEGKIFMTRLSRKPKSVEQAFSLGVG